MQSRFITSGNIKDSTEVILAYELNESEFRLDLFVVPRKLLSNEMLDKLSNDWVSGGSFEFPEGTETISPDINADSILPDYIRSEKTGEIRHKQNEWAVQLLTNKLWESYLIELDRLKKRSEELFSYDKGLFDDAKSYWERVLENKKERNITQERLEKIKEDVNTIFEKLKNFRKSESADFERNSNIARDEIVEKLNQIKQRADEKANFRALHEEIKAVQLEYRNKPFLKADENIARKAFDDAFHYIGEQRNKYFSDKFESRISGLREVMTKIEKGLERDRKDLDYFEKKANNPRIQSLELQLLKVRTRQIKETITSKEDKLRDIQKTMDSIVRQAGKSSHKAEKSSKVEADKQEDVQKEDLNTLPAEENLSRVAAEHPLPDQATELPTIE